MNHKASFSTAAASVQGPRDGRLSSQSEPKRKGAFSSEEEEPIVTKQPACLFNMGDSQSLLSKIILTIGLKEILDSGREPQRVNSGLGRILSSESLISVWAWARPWTSRQTPGRPRQPQGTAERPHAPPVTINPPTRLTYLKYCECQWKPQPGRRLQHGRRWPANGWKESRPQRRRQQSSCPTASAMALGLGCPGLGRSKGRLRPGHGQGRGGAEQDRAATGMGEKPAMAGGRLPQHFKWA